MTRNTSKRRQQLHSFIQMAVKSQMIQSNIQYLIYSTLLIMIKNIVGLQQICSIDLLTLWSYARIAKSFGKVNWFKFWACVGKNRENNYYILSAWMFQDFFGRSIFKSSARRYGTFRDQKSKTYLKDLIWKVSNTTLPPRFFKDFVFYGV